ncbi:hypothetical protein [Leptolyngbya iicbica]|uniref:Uncharacterized protein n=2 Tax=Cyanophyceae TaxID=3028117 RepID=A0A4Q7E5R7_9CYAN|nr:hypothetical protein [Leptolyngbya sp. LK]RZM77300.1 hypothetical protein DYY88_16795 [Leptolyngbya sp. LK]
MDPSTQRPLSLDSAFPCPICRQGTIEAIILTDAFACEFCRHILAANLAQQQVQVVDSSQPLTWGWNGQRWQVMRGDKAQELSMLICILAVVLIVIPASLVWLSGVLFPPLTPTTGLPFSTLWAIITLTAHLTFVLWLVGEYYQIPLYIAAKIRIARSRYSSRP